MSCTRTYGVAIAVLAFVTGMIAAWYWYRASSVPTDPGWYRDDRAEPAIHSLTQDAWITAMLQSASESARLNGIAARWTALTVVLTVISTIASPCGL